MQENQQERNSKCLYLIGVVSLFYVVLIIRLFYVQIIQADLNIRLSKENAMRLKIVTPPRGEILDRNGFVLARNRPSYSICVLPYKLNKIKNRKEVLASLCKITDLKGDTVFDSTELRITMQRANFRRFDATRLKEDVSLDLVSIIEEHSMELPGIIVETESRREYTLGAAAFHVLGYMSEIPEEQFDSLKNQGYFYGDLIGKSGIERQYEKVVRGQSGQEYVEVNAYGKSLGTIPNIPRIAPTVGNDLYLTIDAKLQKVADFSFPDTLKGAVVALDPRSGEVLVMYSSPSVDPNIFSMATSVRSKGWATVALDPQLPLNNRAIGGTYTPGSTFKLVSSFAGLETGKLTRDGFMPTPCRTAFRFGSRIAHCMSSHGSVNLITAVQKSCNIYFYQVGMKVGDEAINTYARMLGMGSVTGVDLPGEKTGWLSGEKAYNIRFAKRGWRWTGGLVLDLAIGQAQVVTPIQLATAVGGLGNTYYTYVPMVVKGERDSSDKLINLRQPQIKSKIEMSDHVAPILKEAMASVVLPGGTGGRATVPGIMVGGKTGSSQNPQGDQTHALFIACAPIDNPVIAIAVVVENAGHGGSIAAPIAGDVLRYFFAETEEGKRIFKQHNPTDTTLIKKLNVMVKPVKDSVDKFFVAQ